MLVGRAQERAAIDSVLGRARSGTSALLALVGEAGIGKTALLDDAAARADGMATLRARGIQSEAQVPFAALLELLRPALGLVDQIPEPQAIALEGALALRPPRAQERFAIGAATLSLLTTYAERTPLVVLIDDAHWLDPSSAQALLFAVRRLMADPIAVLIAVREGEASLLDEAGLPSLRIGGLSTGDAAALLTELPPEASARLHAATAGNPLALLELVSEPEELLLAPDGAPVTVSARVSRAFASRAGDLDAAARRALLLAATSESGDLATLERAADIAGIDLGALMAAEAVGLITVAAGSVDFRHPLARAAVYSGATAAERREAHRVLAHALPDRDVDLRAWHLAAAAAGPDEAASAALEQAGVRARERSAYATAEAAFERGARLAADRDRRARLLVQAADAGWDAGLPDKATTLLDEARASTSDPARLVEIDALAGRIATRRGLVTRGRAILMAAAEHADAERAVAMLAEVVSASFYAGDPATMLAAAEGIQARRSATGSARAAFLAAAADGMARVVGGDAAAGAAAMHEAVELAEADAGLREDPALLPWLAIAPMFLREAGTGRSLLEGALNAARARAALGVLPFVLNLIALDYATTVRWRDAEVSYREAIALARENDQRADLAFGLSGLAWLLARRGAQVECRACAEEALSTSAQLGTRLHEVWALAALGELELGLGDAARAVEWFERQAQLLRELGITDVDLSPATELVEAYVRLGRADDAAAVARDLVAAAGAKGQSWSLARAGRCQGLLAADEDLVATFERALEHHADTPDAFETARTRLVYGERLRRARNRVLAREQLRAARQTFADLGAVPWEERARAELAATGETIRRRDPTTIDELTPQELQIALLLAGGKTTREAAAAVFLSPKTIEYHLRRVYQKLGIHSRPELAEALAARPPEQLREGERRHLGLPS